VRVERDDEVTRRRGDRGEGSHCHVTSLEKKAVPFALERGEATVDSGCRVRVPARSQAAGRTALCLHSPPATGAALPLPNALRFGFEFRLRNR